MAGKEKSKTFSIWIIKSLIFIQKVPNLQKNFRKVWRESCICCNKDQVRARNIWPYQGNQKKLERTIPTLFLTVVVIFWKGKYSVFWKPGLLRYKMKSITPVRGWKGQRQTIMCFVNTTVFVISHHSRLEQQYATEFSGTGIFINNLILVDSKLGYKLSS